MNVLEDNAIAMETLWKEGSQLVYHLADIYLLAKMKEEMYQVSTRVITHLESLGFIINKEKSILTPLHKQEFVDFRFNSTQFNSHEDHSAYEKNQQINQLNQTSFVTTDTYLQMVCQHIRKNDIDDTSD